MKGAKGASAEYILEIVQGSGQLVLNFQLLT